MGEPDGEDDAEEVQAAVVERIAEEGPQSLSELAAGLEVDSGTLFVHLRSLVEAGELRRVNFFTFRVAGAEPDEPAEEEASEEPEADPERPEGDRFWPAADTVDGGVRGAPTESGTRRAAGVTTVLVGLPLAAVGAAGVASIWVGEALGPLPAGFAAEVLATRVGLTDPTLATGVWAGLAAIGLVAAAVGGTLALDLWAPSGASSGEAKD